MDEQRFEELSKKLATSVSRRQAVKILGATAVGGLGALFGARGAFAHHNANCRGVGDNCRSNAECCNGVCTDFHCACPGGMVLCDGITCCPEGTQCCSGLGICCPTDTTRCHPALGCAELCITTFGFPCNSNSDCGPGCTCIQTGSGGVCF